MIWDGYGDCRASIECNQTSLLRLAVGIATVPQTRGLIGSNGKKESHSVWVRYEVVNGALVACLKVRHEQREKKANSPRTAEDANDAAASNTDDMNQRIIAAYRKVGIRILTVLIRIQVAQPSARIELRSLYTDDYSSSTLTRSERRRRSQTSPGLT